MTYHKPNQEDSTTRLVKDSGDIRCQNHTQSILNHVDKKMNEREKKPYEGWVRLLFFAVPISITFFISYASIQRDISVMKLEIENQKREAAEIRKVDQRISVLESKMEYMSPIFIEIKMELSKISKEIVDIRERVIKMETKGEK